MNAAHIHLVITHLPIFGSILGAIVMAQALWTRSNPTKIAAYTVFILSAIGASVAYLTGEGAEETVEGLQGVAEGMIEQHEEFAMFALGSMLLLGLASIAGLLLTLRKSALTRTMATVILLVSLVSFGLAVRTGYLGGQIRHTEISAGTSNAGGAAVEVESDDD
ncbi:MAG: hypothetical protein RLZZ165_1310 [Bacteroidota bacterium]|jgi:uncharacterized membrane protein